MSAVIRVPSVPVTENHIILPGIVETVSANGAYSKVFTPDIAPTDQETLDIARGAISILRAEESLVFVYPVVDGADLDIGTLCRVVNISGSGPEVQGLHGLCRASIQQRLEGGVVLAELFPEDWATAEFSQQLVDKLKAVTMQYIGGHPHLTSRTAALLQMADVAVTPQMLVDLLSCVLPIGFNARVEMLKQLDPVKRCQELINMLQSKLPPSKPLAVQKLRSMSGTKRQEADSQDDDLAELKAKLQNVMPHLPEEGQKVVTRDLKRLSRSPAMSPDSVVIRGYLETVVDIPWAETNVPPLTRDSVKRTQNVLDHDHYGLKKAKQRLVEHVAVSFLRQQANQQSSQVSAPIILLVGPPGVGKTSLAKSIARALERQLYRVSLGGVHDEAEIRGHRRTYIGAMPGVIVQGLRKAGSMNPVLVLDEIDKVGQNSLHGDPAAALLEVLDPAQNSTFKDNYIGFPVDLSQTTFIATANYMETIPAPLLDRMEVIHLPGYSYVEKEHIARQYLWPKQLKENGLGDNSIGLDDEAMRLVITGYTRESGVRSLERQLGSICRALAVKSLDQKPEAKSTAKETALLGVSDVHDLLGPEIFHDDIVNDEVDNCIAGDGTTITRHSPGVVNGLAYMRSGLGGIMVFEATKIPGGSGKLKLTGALGDVISESANIALSWVRGNSAILGIDAKEFSKYDIHLHAPAGAIPKNGPSAGVAMTVCFVSLLTNRKVSRDLAMTGEITLRGKVLPVGGIREKLLGAHLAGIRRVILPFHCRAVVEEEFNASAKGSSAAELETVYAKYIWDVFAEVWPQETSLWQMYSNM